MSSAWMSCIGVMNNANTVQIDRRETRLKCGQTALAHVVNLRCAGLFHKTRGTRELIAPR